jgi:signal peptidase
MVATALDVVFRSVRVVIGIGLLAFLVFRGVLIVSGWISETGTPSVFGREVFVVRSGSMSPEFETGDAVLVSMMHGSSAGDLEVGDVITFRPVSDGSILISHRIVEELVNSSGRSFYMTKGDANESPDTELVSLDRVVGRVDMRLPYMGRLLVASQGFGLMTLMGISFFLAHVSVALGSSARNLNREPLLREGTPNERTVQ